MPKPLNLKSLKQKLKNPNIRIYTYQHKDILQQIDQQGYLTGEHQYAMTRANADWINAYCWMKMQASNRIKNFSGDSVLWAWPTRQHNKLVLKSYGEDIVRIVAVVPTCRIIASCFHWWHNVLVDIPVVTDDEENKMSKAEKLKTWQRIFELDFSIQPSAIQLCVDRIYQHEIQSIREY